MNASMHTVDIIIVYQTTHVIMGKFYTYKVYNIIYGRSSSIDITIYCYANIDTLLLPLTLYKINAHIQGGLKHWVANSAQPP